MNQSEIECFLGFVEAVCGARWESCDESQHVYHGDDYIGGWAGDERRFFTIECDKTALLVCMWTAALEEMGDDPMGDMMGRNL